MDTLRRIPVDISYNVLIDLLCHERDHGSRCLCNGHKGSVQGHIGIDLILFHTFCPETLAASAHIPVAHIVYKLLERSCRLRDLVIHQVIVNRLYHGIHLG